MRIVLVDRDYKNFDFPEDVKVIKAGGTEIKDYENNSEVVAISGSRATARLVSSLNFPSLKLYQLTSAGFDNVPLDYFNEKGIYLCNAGSVYSAPIAESVVFGVLLMAKKLNKNPNLRIPRLTRGYSKFITEILNKKILILGAGSIGTEIASRFMGFGAEIVGFDPFCPEKEQFKRIIRSTDDLINEIGEFDYIISTMPLNETTRGFISSSLIEKMKNTAVIVNISRRGVFSEDALYKALKEKKIGGAVLDMFEKLPNPLTNRFRRLKNTVVFPGVTAISKETNDRLLFHIHGNITLFLEGVTPKFIVNEVK